jgi:hypothetical protein
MRRHVVEEFRVEKALMDEPWTTERRVSKKAWMHEPWAHEPRVSKARAGEAWVAAHREPAAAKAMCARVASQQCEPKGQGSQRFLDHGDLLS